MLDKRRTEPAWRLLALMAGFGAWSVAFVALYGTLSVGCALGWNDIAMGPIPLLRLLLVAGFIVSLLGLGLIARALRDGAQREDNGGRDLVAQLSYRLALAALAAGLFTYAPVLFLTACQP